MREKIKGLIDEILDYHESATHAYYAENDWAMECAMERMWEKEGELVDILENWTLSAEEQRSIERCLRTIGVSV